jgi:tRNA U34 5-carboxymethylaminomethyl modifying enzyme MnmG/GidA
MLRIDNGIYGVILKNLVNFKKKEKNHAHPPINNSVFRNSLHRRQGIECKSTTTTKNFLKHIHRQ